MKIPINVQINFIPEAVPEGWDAIEVHGVREYAFDANHPEDGTHCEQVDDHLAQFWSVYLHKTGQGVDCVADLPTRELAEALAELLEAASDYRGTQDPPRCSICCGTPCRCRPGCGAKHDA